MSKVYVSQSQDRIDYSDAERFGALVFCTGYEYPKHSANPRCRMVVQDVANSMKDFDPAKDYLILTGNPITMGYTFYWAMLRAAALGFAKIRVLQWDRNDQAYREVIFDGSLT